jgi:hypothetical protein
MYNFFLNTTDYEDQKSIWKPMAYLSSQIPRLNKLGGFQGYFYVRTNGIHGSFLCPNEFANVTNMNALMNPVLDTMKDMPGMDPKSLIKRPPVDIQAALTGTLQGANGGAATTGPAAPKGTGTGMRKRHGPGQENVKKSMYGILDQDSSLLGEEELTHPNLAGALEKSMRHGDTGQFRAHVVGGNKVIAYDSDESSVNPAWRRAYIHLMVTGNEKVYQGPLRELSPKTGAYINEVSFICGSSATFVQLTRRKGLA